ncbi:tetratricopeptide repeat protein [bacterium]|nr:tetratricopeptide repeat protein [bacterium]
MENTRLKILTGGLLLTLALACACSTPSAPEFNIEPAYLSDVSKGWSLFAQGNFALAATSFRSAIARDVQQDYYEAHIGLGWAMAMQDSLQKAVLNFDLALDRAPKDSRDSVNILSGLSFAYRDLNPPDYQKVRDDAVVVLEKDPSFVFAYRTSINAQDVKAVLAEAYFNLGQYEEAAAIADPGGTLDPSADDYNQKLLSKINQLLTISREGV